MIYQYQEIIDQGLFENAFIVSMTAKETAIHQGHIEMIQYAQGLGKTYVLINLNHDAYVHFLLSGKIIESIMKPENIEEQLASIQKLGVDVILHNYSYKIPEQTRKDALEKCKHTFEAMTDNRILSNSKMSGCIIKLMEYLFWEPKIIGCTWVRGPDPENFLLKVAIRRINKDMNIGFPDRIVIFPKMIKDENGLRLRTHYPTLKDEQIEIFKGIVKQIQVIRKDFEWGNNFALVKTLNESLKNVYWKYDEILVWGGGVFGKCRLESVTIAFGNQRIEEVTCHVMP